LSIKPKAKITDAVLTIVEPTPHPSGITPFEFKVLIRPDAAKEKTGGGIFLPQDIQADQQRAIQKGTIEAISPAAFSYHAWPAEVRIPRVGDRVLYARYSGTLIEGKDGQDYRLINDKDIGAVISF
jgi:chaperonin GroES